MNTADAFVRVAACNNKARDSGVDFIVEIGKEIGREFCATSVFRSLGGVVSFCIALLPHLGAPTRQSAAACLLLAVVSRHSSSVVRGQCGPAWTKGDSAAPSCLLHLKPLAARAWMLNPSIEREKETSKRRRVGGIGAQPKLTAVSAQHVVCHQSGLVSSDPHQSGASPKPYTGEALRHAKAIGGGEISSKCYHAQASPLHPEHATATNNIILGSTRYFCYDTFPLTAHRA